MRRFLAMLLLFVSALGALYEWGGPARRGVRELKAGRYDEAARAFREARREMPKEAVIPYDEGLALLGKGEADSAEARFQEAMRLRGDLARAAAAYNLGNRAMRAKDYGRAASYYKDALRVRSEDLDTKKNLEEALRRMRESRPENRQQPPSGGKGPPTPGAEALPPRPSPESMNQRPASPRAGDFTPEEAQRWLQALEAERRAKRREGKAPPTEETGNRDW